MRVALAAPEASSITWSHLEKFVPGSYVRMAPLGEILTISIVTKMNIATPPSSSTYHA
jgi:hypothetical protein